MSSAWQLAKRHKGKLAVGGALVAAGVYVATEHGDQLRHWWRAASGYVSGPQRDDAVFAAQARRHYVFDSQQRAADDSVMRLSDDVRQAVEAQFEVDALIARLKAGAAHMGAEEKLAQWDKIKVETIGRLVCAGFAYTIVITVLKAQVAILSADIYAHSLGAQPIHNEDSLRDKFWGMLGYGRDGGSGRLNGMAADADLAIAQSSVDPQAQQLFLQCIQYFMRHGVAALAGRVRAAAEKCCAGRQLGDKVDAEGFRQLLLEVAKETIGGDCGNFSELVVPPSACDPAAALAPSHTRRLGVLLNRLTAALQCHHARLLTSHCTSVFARAAADFVRQRVALATARSNEVGAPANNNDEGEEPRAVPLAKLLPMAADCFGHVAQCDFDRPAQEVLMGAQLHQYCVKIFEGLGEG